MEKHGATVTAASARWIRLFVLMAGLAIVPIRAGTTGRITGEVKDAGGAPVSGAKVVVTSTSKGIKNTAVTDKKGVYHFITLAPGLYILEVQANGFKAATRKGLVVHVDSAITIDLLLDSSEAGTDASK